MSIFSNKKRKKSIISNKKKEEIPYLDMSYGMKNIK